MAVQFSDDEKRLDLFPRLGTNKRMIWKLNRGGRVRVAVHVCREGGLQCNAITHQELQLAVQRKMAMRQRDVALLSSLPCEHLLPPSDAAARRSARARTHAHSSAPSPACRCTHTRGQAGRQKKQMHPL